MPEKRCTGDCLKCSLQQQMYCAAQRTYAIMGLMPQLNERLDSVEKALSSFTQNEVFNPLKDDAQKDSGAENREPTQY